MTTWLTPQQVADVIGEHRHTIYRRLECGEIHAHKTGRRWRVHPDVPDVWVRGGDTRQPCGCARITPLRKARSA